MTRVHPYSTFYNGVLMPFMSHIKIRIRIRIRTDLKSEIRIRRMRFSAGSVTSLHGIATIFYKLYPDTHNRHESDFQV